MFTVKKKVVSIILSLTLLISLGSILNSCGGKDDDDKKGIKNTPVAIEELKDTKKNDDFEYDVFQTYVEIIAYVGKDENVVVPDTIDNLPVHSIGIYAFSNLENVKTIKLPDELKNIADTAFYNCMNLTQVTLPKKLYSIGSNAFGNCDKLSNIVLPDGLCKIGTYAFGGCYELEAITIPSSIEKIDGGAFAYTKWLENQKEDFVMAGDGIMIAYNGKSEEVVVPNTVKQVAGFFDTTTVQKITLSEGVKTISDAAFNNCTASIIIIPNTVTEIGKNAFANCQGIKNISLPSSLLEIGRTAFSGCANLEKIVIPASVKSIGDNAFLRCAKLEKVTFMGGELTIGTNVFEGCDIVQIEAEKNTNAHKYALENNYKFLEMK